MKSLNNPLLRGGFIILAGNLAGGVFNYLFHPLAGRFLTPTDYGLFEALMALAYFWGIFSGGYSFAVIDSVSKIEHENGIPLRQMEILAVKISLFLGGGAFLFYPAASRLLHFYNFSLYALFSSQIFFGLLSTTYLSLLLSRYRFFLSSLVGFLTSISRVFFSFLLMKAGFGIFGAVGGLLFSSLTAVVLGRILAGRFLIGRQRKTFPQKSFAGRPFWNYLSLSVVTNFALISLYSADILLVRNFFSAFESGVYSAAAVLGKIILFGASAFLSAAFPVFVKNKGHQTALRKFLLLSLLFLSVSSLTALFFYFFIPEQIIRLVYGASYQTAVNILGLFALFMALNAFFNLFIQFILALEKRAAGYISVTAALIQVFLIFFRHKNFGEVIGNSVAAVSVGIALCLVFLKFANIQKDES